MILLTIIPEVIIVLSAIACILIAMCIWDYREIRRQDKKQAQQLNVRW